MRVLRVSLLRIGCLVARQQNLPPVLDRISNTTAIAGVGIRVLRVLGVQFNCMVHNKFVVFLS